MTDDTLRQECEKLLDSLEATYPDVALGGTLVDVDKKYKADCAKILAFARAQQVKGIRVVKQEMVDSRNPKLTGWIDWCEAKATAREECGDSLK